MEIIIKDVRGAFLNVFKPKQAKSGPRYGGAFPIEPNSANHKLLVATMREVAEKKWDKKGPAILAQLIKAGDVFFKEDAAQDDEGNVYEGFEGMFTMNAGQAEDRGAPTIIDKRKDPKTGDFPRLTSKDGRPYSGCYVNVKVDVWAQDKPADEGGKRINAALKTIQFVRDGDAFGSAGPGTSEGFEEVTDGADADDIA